MAATLRAELRQEGARDADEAEDICFDDGKEFRFGRLFDAARDAVAGVIHEHVDAVECRDGFGGDGLDLLGLGDVEREDARGVRILFSEVGDLLGLASCGDHTSAGFEDFFGQ